MQSPQRARGDEPGQPRHVIEMRVGQQHVAEPAKPEPGAQQLALRPLAAIDQKPVRPAADTSAGKPRSAEGTAAAVPRKTRSNIGSAASPAMRQSDPGKPKSSDRPG